MHAYTRGWAVGPILPHVGWIVIGVGDSFVCCVLVVYAEQTKNGNNVQGAIIGKAYGRTKWSFSNCKSIEGSVGMLSSMIACLG